MYLKIFFVKTEFKNLKYYGLQNSWKWKMVYKAGGRKSIDFLENRSFFLENRLFFLKTALVPLFSVKSGNAHGSPCPFLCLICPN
jgi:hypothetical protein